MTRIDRRNLLLAAAGSGLAACASTGVQADSSLLVDLARTPDEVIDLWPGGPPGGVPDGLVEEIIERENVYGLRDRAALNITRPTLSVFRPANPDGTAILLIPGGGYARVVIDKEGFEGARYFNQRRTSAYVLKYRLPQQGWRAGADTPLQDAQRAMRIIRANAPRSGIDPARIMVMGFSAGGHLAGSLCQRFDERTYAPIDDIDTHNARPDLGVLVYPVALMAAPHGHAGSRTNLIGAMPTPGEQDRYDLTSAPNPAGPPLFLLHALDDESVPVENSLEMATACRRAGISAVIHTFSAGGHGFGMRGIDSAPVGRWPQLVLDWAHAQWT